MARYKVIGGLSGAYMPSYDSGLLESKKRAKQVLTDKKREFRDHPDYTIKSESNERFRVDRPGNRTIDYVYKISKVSEEDVGVA